MKHPYVYLGSKKTMCNPTNQGLDGLSFSMDFQHASTQFLKHMEKSSEREAVIT